MKRIFRLIGTFIKSRSGFRSSDIDGRVYPQRTEKYSYYEDLDNYINELRKGRYSYLPLIFCVFAENSDVHKLIAANEINNYFIDMNFIDNYRIERQMRQSFSVGYGIDWKKFDVHDFFTKDMSLSQKRVIVILSSMCANGYLRERAVKHLCLFKDTLPYIIMRTNDWVPQVQAMAYAAFNERIFVAEKDELLNSLPFLERLRKCKHVTYSLLADFVNSRMISPEGNEIIKYGLRSKNIRIRSSCINMIFNFKMMDLFPARELLKGESDPFLRKIIFKNFMDMGLSLDDLCEEFTNDSFYQNRILGLQYMYEHNINGVLTYAMDKIFDKSASVRDLARKIVGEISPSFDIREAYISGLDTITGPSISGIGDVGVPSDANIIDKYLYSDNISFVKSTIISLARLNAEKYRVEITEKLLSTHPGVVKISQYVIQKYKIYDFNRIFSIYNESKIKDTRIKCAHLLFCAAKWQRLIYMLQLLSSNEKEIIDLSLLSISRWLCLYNRSYAELSRKDRKTIIGLMETHRDKFKHIPKQKDDLMFILA